MKYGASDCENTSFVQSETRTRVPTSQYNLSMYEIKSHSKKTLLMKKAKNLTSHSNTDQIQTPHALAALPLPSSLAKTKQK